MNHREMSFCGCARNRGWAYDPRSTYWVCADCKLPSALWYQSVIEFKSDKEHIFVSNDTTPSVADFIKALGKFLVEYADQNGLEPPFETDTTDTEDKPVKGGRRGAAKTKTKVVVDDEEDEDGKEEGDADDRRAQLEKLSLTALRKLAVKEGFDKEDVNSSSQEELIDSLLDPDNQDDEEDDDEDDEDGDDGEEKTYTEAELKKLRLPALRKLAEDEWGWEKSDYEGMDKDTLIQEMLESQDAEDEEDEDEDDDEGYTKADLEEMDLRSLRGIAKELSLKVPVGTKQAKIVEMILEAQ
jgi:hypothetical protein